MAKLIIGMGLPGAGKSTLLKKFASKYEYDYISIDDIRKENGLTSGQPSTNYEWDNIRSRTLESYRSGKTVVVDATFLGDARQKFLDFAHENGIGKIQGLFVNTPEEIAWERNQMREHKTSREVFEERLSHLKNLPPEVSEGFDSIFTVDENAEMVGVELLKEHAREFKPRSRFR